MNYIFLLFSKLIYLSKIIFINFLILYVSLLLLEIGFQIKNNNFLDDNRFSYREKILGNYETDVHLSYYPYKLLSSNQDLIPLSGISNSKSILCSYDNNDSKLSFYSYQSDKYGFNNPNNDINFDIAVIGDSYVHGLCVEPNFNLVNQIIKSNYQVKNLGMSANGPLLEYATYREYADEFNFQKLIWVLNPDNDFYDFSNELNDTTLNRYLEDSNYKQQLILKNETKDKLILEYFNYDGRRLKEYFKHYHLDLKFLRKSISMIYKNYIFNLKDDSMNSTLEKKSVHFIGKEQLDLINSIFIDLQQRVFRSDRELLVVINAIDPFYTFSDDLKVRQDLGVIINNKNYIKSFLKKNNISFIDYDNYIYSIYSKDDIDKVFKKTKNGYDHYTNYGYQILSEKIISYFR